MHKHNRAIALGSGVAADKGGYALEAAVGNRGDRALKKNKSIKQRTDETVQGRLEYKNVNAMLTGGHEFISAMNRAKPSQVWSGSAGHYGGAASKYSGQKQKVGGFEYDELGRPMTKVPIAMGGIPVAGYDLLNAPLSYAFLDQEQKQQNPYYIGLFGQHTSVA